MATIPAYAIGGFIRPELHTDSAGNIILDPVAAQFVATYGTKALYMGLPANTPFPPVSASLSAPSDANAAANSVAEGAPANTPVGLTVSATSSSGNPVTYALTDSAGGRFQIDATTGVVSVANGALLDYESSTGHTVTVQASSGGLVTSQSFSIGVTDINDNAPVFTSGTTATTPENVPTTTAVYTAHATDADGTAANNTVHYTLAAGGDNALFDINATTGAVTFKASPDADHPQDAGLDNTYNITVTASDGLAAHNVTRGVAITVSDVNEAPVITSNGGGDNASVSINEGATAVTTVTATDPDVPLQTLTFSVLTGAGSPDGASFGIDGSGNLTFLSAPDFEAPGSAANSNTYTVQVQVTDSGNPLLHDIQTITVDVADVNEKTPVITSSATMAVDENTAAGGHVGAVTATDADGSAPNNTVSFTATGGTGLGLFDVDPTTGEVTVHSGTVLDYETTTSYTLDVEAADGGTPSLFATQTLTINLNDLNDNTPSISGAVAMAVDENAAGGAHVGTVLATDGDGTAPNNTLTYTATGGSGQALFDINATTGEVTVHAGAVLDRETAASYTLDVKIADGGTPGLFTNQTIAINLNDLNDVTPSITSSAAMTVDEASAGGTSVGTVTASDGDATAPNNTITYSATGGTGQALFDIDPTTGAVTVHAGAVLNFESTPSYTLDVKATDGGALFAAQTLNISLNNLAPAFATPPDSNASGNQTYDGAPAGSSTGIHAAAADPAGGAVSYVLFDNAGGRFAINSGTGVVTVGTTPIVFDSGTPANNTVTITVRASDAAGAHSDHTYDIVILQELPPEITAGNTLNYTENQAATVIDSALTVVDANNATLAGATVQITTNYVQGEDVLAFANTATITGTFNALTGTLTLSGTDTVANYQAALRAVTYVNTSDNPSGAPRTVSFTANDGIVNSAAATDTINVTPVNDAPAIAANHSLGYTENQAATAIDPALTLTDLDSANITGASVQITGNYVNGQDILGFANTASITGSFDAVSGTLTLSGTDTVGNYQAALRAVTYFNSSDAPSTLSRTVTFTATDGAATSTAVTGTIIVAAVDDAPAVTAGHILNYAENDAATAIDAAVTVSDVDSANLTSATVQITGNYVEGQDLLSFTNQNGITGAFNATTGTLSLSGSSSVANYQTALRSVTYANNSSNPAALDRTVTFIASDGAASSTPATSTIHVTAVNSAPDLTPNSPSAASYTENAAATALLSTGAITDPDNPTNFSGGSFTAAITTNSAAGDQIVLLGSSPFAVSGSSLLYAGNVVGTVTGLGTDSVSVSGLTTIATPTVINLLAKAFGFLNTTEDPATAPRTVTFTFHDGGNTGGGDLTDSVAQTVNVTAVNDAPVNTVPATVQLTDAATDLAISGMSVSDVDSEGLSETTTLHVANGTLVVASAGGASVGGSGTATVTLTGTIAEINTTLAAAGNILYHPGAAGSDTLTVTTNDGGHSPSGALTDVDTVPILVTAAPAAGAPALDLDGSAGGTGFTASFTEGSLAATPIADTDATIVDAASPTIASATITLTNHQAGDTLAVNGTLPTGIVASSYNASTGVLTLTGSATLADYQTALHQVEFSNSSDNPSTADRSIGVVVNDGTNNSNVAIATIHVAAVNDAPVVDLDGGGIGIDYTAHYITTGAFVPIASSNDSVTDADNAILASATITLTDAKPNDMLAISGTLPSGITATIDTSVANQITVTLTGAASPALYQAALHQVVFANSDANADVSDRHVTVTVSDGTDASLVATTTINVTANTPPVANADAVSATEAGGVNNAVAGVNPSGNLITGTGAAGAVADTDDLDPASALKVVAVHTGAVGGTAGTVGAGLAGTYGTLALNADGSYSYAVDNSNTTVQALLPASPVITDVFNYTIQDSGGLQSTATLTVSIHGANDLPQATADTGNMTEDAAATTFGVLANDSTDPDSGALNTVATGTVLASGPAGTNIDATDVTVAVVGGTQIQVTLGADFQRLASSETATVTVPYILTGNSGETSTANLVITVNGVNDLPVAVNDTGFTMTEDAAATTFASVLTNDTLDKDHGALNSITVTPGTATASGPAGTGIDGSDVTVTVIGGSQIRVQLGADFQHLQEGQTATIDVPYILHGDGTDASTGTFEVTVSGANDAPVVTAGAGATYTENGAAVSVAGSLTLTDIDNTTMSGATVSLTNAQAGDVLSVQGQGTSGDLASGVHFVVDNSAHTVTFSNTEAASDYQAALRLVQFSNSGENPATASRSFTITADDGQTLNHTASASASLTVIATDDAPVNTIPADSAVATAFSNTDTAISGISVTDVDSGSGIITTQLSVTHGTIAVSLAGGATISAGATGTATLTLSGTAAAINATLANNVVFHSTDGYTGQADLTVVTNDQGFTGTGGPLSDTDVVHIGVVPQVWYIDNTNSGPGTGAGTVANPFHSIHDFNVSSGPGQNDYIVLRTGTGTYTGEGLNLQDGQQLYGSGETLSFTNPVNGNVVTVLNGTGTRPTINVTTNGDQGIDLAANNTIHGVNITTAAGTTGLDDGNNAVGTLTIDHMAISGAGQAVDIDQGGALSVALESVSSSGGSQGIQLASTSSSGAGLLSGSFSTTGGTISSGATAGVSLIGVAATVTVASAITTSSGHSVEVTNSGSTAAGGNQITFSGLVTDSGLGINLDNNDQNTNGATVTFSGGLNIDSTTHIGFNAVNGGTVNVTDSDGSSTGIVNSISTTTGVALNVVDTNIGANDLTLTDISANGASKAIILNNTGSAGGLHVTGNGATNGSGDGTGGTIQNISTRGIELINTAEVSINNVNLTNANTGNGTSLDLDISGSNAAIYMSGVSGAGFNNININGTADNGITGLNVSDFTLANSTITHAGNAANESGIEFSNLSGTSAITNSDISFSATNSLDIVNTDANLNLTVTGSTFRDTQTVSSGGANNNLGEGGIQFRSFSNAAGAPTTNLIIDDNDFLRLRTQGIQVIGEDDSLVNVDITDNTIDAWAGVAGIPAVAGTNIGVGIDINGNDNATVNYNAFRNIIKSNGGSGVNITSFLDADVMGRVQDNTITIANVGEGVRALAQETSHNIIEIKHNDITQLAGSNSSAITAQARFQSARLDITIDNNTTKVNSTAVDDIDIIGGSSAANETAQVFADIKNNHASNGATNVLRLRVSDLNGTSDPRIFLTGFVEGGAGQDDDAVATWNAKGNTPTATTANINVSLTGTAVAPSAGTALTPTNPMPSTLRAASGGVQASSPTAGERHLSQAQLDTIVTAAVAQWAHAGASMGQLAALAAITFAVADLGGNAVGDHTPGHITIDTDAAGHGWFVDATPNDNFEFASAANAAGTDLYTDPANAAAGHLDLLTTVAHEMGHELGLPDLSAAAGAHDLMFVELVDGERRLPGATDAAQARTTDVPPTSAGVAVDAPQLHAAPLPSTQAWLGGNVIIGTSGNDTIDAGHGGYVLFGDRGADTFVFADVTVGGSAPPMTRVVDYHFAEGDRFDFSALIPQNHGTGMGDSWLVRAVEDPSGSSATLQVNATPSQKMSTWVDVAQLDNMHAGDAVSVLIDPGAVHLAQIHVGLL